MSAAREEPARRRGPADRDLGMAAGRRAQGIGFDPGPGARVGHQRAQHRVVELVAAAHRAVGRQQGPSGERQIADRVEHLVADELVGEAHAFRVEDAVVGDDQRVLERGAERVAGVPQRRHIAHEAEGARARDLAAEAVGLHVDGQRLVADQRMVVVDLGLDAEAARIGRDLAIGVAHRDPHRLEHADIAARLIERRDADGIDRRHERRRAAVHDRRFRTVDLDHRIVDAQAGQRGQNMLGGGHQRPGFVPQHGGEFGGGDRSHVGRDLAIVPAVDARPHEP